MGLDSFRYKGFPVLASALTLSIYLALSVTGISPFIVLVPLILSGLFLAMDASESPPPAIEGRYRGLEMASALLFASALLSTVFSYNPRDSVEAGVVLFPGLLMAYILVQILQSHSHVVAWGVIAMVFTASVVSLAMFAGSPGADAGQVFQAGKTPALVVPNDMVLGVIFSPLILHSIITERRVVLKLMAFGVMLALLVSLYYVKSRICLLTAFVVFGLYLRHYFQRYFIRGFLAAIVAVIVVDRLFSLNIAQDFALISEESTRLAIWYAGLDSVRQHPIVGFGPSQFYIAYEQVISSASLPDWLVLDPRGVPWAHNIFLEALAERGVLGLGVFVFLLVHIHNRLYASVRQMENAEHSLSFAIYVAFLAFLFAGLFELTLQRIWVANALFIFIGFALWNNSPKTDIPAKTGSDPT